MHDREPDVSEERDRGLAVERTDLAWNRSGLALLACLAIVARRFFPLDTRVDHVAAYLLLGLGGLSWAFGLLLGRRAAESARHGAPAAARLRVATGSTVVIAVAAFALDLFPPEE